MVSLLSLPNEILHRIIECVDLGDLEHFSASCPLLESLAKDALEVHHTRKQRYTQITLKGCHDRDYDEDHHPLYLLREICKNPQVAWYPTSLRVECCGCKEKVHDDEDMGELLYNWEVIDQWKSDAVFVRKIMQDCAQEVQKLVFDSGYFNRLGRERWYNHIRKGSRGAALGLLLTLLPNLEILIFHQYTWNARIFKKIVQRITKPHGRKSAETYKEGAKVLTKLREVRHYGGANDGHWDVFEDFDLAGYFAKLPSMRKVCATSAKTHSRPRPGNNPWMEIKHHTSNIDDISIGYGTMTATSISNCLRSLKTLRKFHYDYSSLWGFHHALDRSGVITILEALLEHAKTSLEFLSLNAGHRSPLQGSTAIPLSLITFKKLKKASLSCHLYAPVFKPHKEEPEVSAHDKTKPFDIGINDSRFQNPNLFNVSKLVDILPNSIEIIKFFGEVAMGHVKAMLQGLVEHRADRLPHLEEIVFYEAADTATDAVAEIAKALQEECSGIGIRLVLGNRSKRNGHQERDIRREI